MKKMLCLMAVALPLGLHAQQVADMGYAPVIGRPAYANGAGPVVFIDEGHHNFHTKDGRYSPFARLLARDGYVVKAYQGPFSEQGLAGGKILVVANALHPDNVGRWVVPTYSAFSKAEIETVRRWVCEGGRLFLIADHMPMAGAAEAMAKAFGFLFTNGFALAKKGDGPTVFTLGDGTLAANAITKGRGASEQVAQVASFTGQAFQIPDDATPILAFDDQYVNLLPDTAWVFGPHTPSHPIGGWAQGAYKPYGKGRVVVFGEAAMFTAQLSGPGKRKMGMNKKVAKENHQLALNIVHWLDGLID